MGLHFSPCPSGNSHLTNTHWTLAMSQVLRRSWRWTGGTFFSHTQLRIWKTGNNWNHKKAKSTDEMVSPMNTTLGDSGEQQQAEELKTTHVHVEIRDDLSSIPHLSTVAMLGSVLLLLRRASLSIAYLTAAPVSVPTHTHCDNPNVCLQILLMFSGTVCKGTGSHLVRTIALELSSLRMCLSTATHFQWWLWLGNHSSWASAPKGVEGNCQHLMASLIWRDKEIASHSKVSIVHQLSLICLAKRLLAHWWQKGAKSHIDSSCCPHKLVQPLKLKKKKKAKKSLPQNNQRR